MFLECIFEVEMETLLKQYWGYDRFLPLQQEAVSAILNKQDSLVILPTGGGKSLCYQLPVLTMTGTAIVVSPLISLMKDQVDTLNSLNIPAGYLNNSLTEEERETTLQKLAAGAYKLFYVAPERLAAGGFLNTLKRCQLVYFVVDESHCISQWGHDFRPAYRMLTTLRKQFPDLPIHAFTATATPSVREDIIRALSLKQYTQLVGDFDRPNLRYRVQYRDSLIRQVCEVIDRHPNEGGIVYCISRKDVDDLAQKLREKGYNALAYHAGLADTIKSRHQEAFTNETVDIIVATVAFGMGIDRSNVRYVIHAGMPKSIENYQQEAGRAGRDRLPAECVLLFTGNDIRKWQQITGEPETEYDHHALKMLHEMAGYCQRQVCRHQFLVEYFGQPFDRSNCGQCDVCLGEFETMADSETIARKILSGVARVKESFGAHHVSEILRGSNSEKVKQYNHHMLSTHGLLKEFSKQAVMLWLGQLVDRTLLVKEPEYGILKLTPSGAEFLKNGGQIALMRPAKLFDKERLPARERNKLDTLNESDSGLFEALRQKRRALAAEKRVAPFIIFSDVSLRDMARQKPTSLAAFRNVKGVGETKLNDLCPHFLDVILAFGTC